MGVRSVGRAGALRPDRELVPGQRLVMSMAEGPFPMETT